MLLPSYNFEQNLKSQYKLIAGIDEAGRGPLAGPVVAAACILDIEKINQLPEQQKKLIRDSKKLSPKQREEIFEIIIQNSQYGVGEVGHQTIDEINIFNATFLAMRLAIDNLAIEPDYILVDGNKIIPKLNLPQQAIINGDSLSLSIASASIIAKVTRDRLMMQYHQQYPQYGFNEHCGYGTEKHFAAIVKYGPSPIHRLSFSPFAQNMLK